jgi:hypothetical protein
VKSVENQPMLRRLRAYPKRRLIFDGLHGVIFQKIELFLTAAVRTSNPTGSFIIAAQFTCNFLTMQFLVTVNLGFPAPGQSEVVVL